MSAIDDEAANYIRTVFSESPEPKIKKAVSVSKSKKIGKIATAQVKTKKAKTVVKRKTAARKTKTVKKKTVTKTKKTTTIAKKTATKTTTGKKTAASKKTATKTATAKKTLKRTKKTEKEVPAMQESAAVKTSTTIKEPLSEIQEPKAPKKLALKIVKKEEKPKTKKVKTPAPILSATLLARSASRV